MVVEYLFEGKVNAYALSRTGRSMGRCGICKLNGVDVNFSSRYHDSFALQVINTQQTFSNFSYDALKADVWAAGVLLCVMLTGRFPYENYMLSALANNLQSSEDEARPRPKDTLRAYSLIPRKTNIKW